MVPETIKSQDKISYFVQPGNESCISEEIGTGADGALWTVGVCKMLCPLCEMRESWHNHNTLLSSQKDDGVKESRRSNEKVLDGGTKMVNFGLPWHTRVLAWCLTHDWHKIHIFFSEQMIDSQIIQPGKAESAKSPDLLTHICSLPWPWASPGWGFPRPSQKRGSVQGKASGGPNPNPSMAQATPGQEVFLL